MTLHEEIIQILKEAGKPLTTSKISDLVNKRKKYLKKDNSDVSPFQIHGRTRNYSNLFLRNKTLVGLKGRDEKVINNVEYAGPTKNDFRANNPIISRIFTNNIPDQVSEKSPVQNEEYLNRSGFKKIGTVKKILNEGLPEIDELNSSGIYAITKPKDYSPKYYTPEESKLKGNVINAWSVEQLHVKWVDNVDVLYFGLAGAHSPRSLKLRLKDLINHSKGLTSDRGPHKGGEIIWQLKGYEDFEIWVLPTGNPPEPRILEENLLRQFYQTTGKLPFANKQF